MKTIIQLTIILFLFTGSHSFSQQLKVGDKAPDMLVFKWLKGDHILEWKKDHFYLIEFGATWCKPCIAAIPELDSIQRAYKDKLTVASLFVMERNNELPTVVEPQYVTGVERFVEKRKEKISYTVGIDNPTELLVKTWLNSAGLSGIPHMFIIDNNGYIRWIGTSTGKAKEVIRQLMNNPITKLVTDTELKYDRSKLLLIGNNGGNESDFLFRSILTRYDGKINGNSLEHIQNFFQLKPDSVFDSEEDKLEIIGAPLLKLYYMAYSDTLSNTITTRFRKVYADTIQKPYIKTTYGKYWHEPILDVKDLTPFEYSWKNKRNRFNYSLKVPKGMGTAQFLQQTLQRDLATYFGFNVNVETRLMPYWRVTAPDKAVAVEKLKSKDQAMAFERKSEEGLFKYRNAIMRDIITLLGITYGYGGFDYGRLAKSEQAAFIDETSIMDKIDFDFNQNLSFEETCAALQKLGLVVSKEFRNMKVVVIHD